MSTSNVRGIKTENDLRDARFVNFFRIVQDEAKREGCVFFLLAGEGHELITDDLDGENLSGWLIKHNEADAFEKQWASGMDSIDEEYTGDIRFSKWSIGRNGDIEISFI